MFLFDKFKKNILKVPVMIQMEAAECGAASLGMVLGYYKRFVLLEELRELCGVSRDGVSGGKIMDVAESYGLTPDAYSVDVKELEDVKLPAILYWEDNHFLVLCGIHNKKYYVTDPNYGLRTLTEKQVEDSFSNVVFTFEPNEKFKEGGQKKRTLPIILDWLKYDRKTLLFITLATLFLVVPGTVNSDLPRVIIDNVFVEGQLRWIYPILAVMIIMFIISITLGFAQQMAMLKLQYKLLLTNSGKFLNHLFKLPMSFFDQRFPGEVFSRFSLNEMIVNLLTNGITINLFNIIMIFIYAFVMLRLDWILALIAFLVTIINFVCLKFIGFKRRTINQSMINDRGKFTGTSMSGIQMIEHIKSTGIEESFFSTWAGYHAKYLNGIQKLGLSTSVISLVPTFLTGLNATTILFIGSIQIMSGDLTIGILLAFQMFVGLFMGPVNALVGLGVQMQEVVADFDRLYDVFNHKTNDEIQAVINNKNEPFIDKNIELHVKDKPKLTGRIEVKNLTFGYSKVSKPLIENFNLTINPGRRVALVGRTGSGKSTVSNLLTGLYSPWSGEILIDGQSINIYDKTYLAGSLSCVNQDILLFSGTVKENITMWDNTIILSDVRQAAIDACIDEEICSRDEGYNSLIDERGKNYSSGQRQRLEIARALVTNPSILVLDEATAALDPNTEKIIDDNIRRRGCSCLIVAHRLSTIKDCDEIIVMDKGQIAERGTHEELIKNDGYYSDLVKSM